MIPAMPRTAAGRRGYVLLAAICVLAVLFLIAATAADTTQTTWRLASKSAVEHALCDAMHDAAYRVMSGDRPSTAPAAAALARAATLRGDVTVSATLLAKDAPALPAHIAPRGHDEFIRIEARHGRSGGCRKALYLVNRSGLRQAPILLLEERS